MPFYEFTCLDCKRNSVVLVPRTDWTGTRCPECDSQRLEKNLSVFATSSGSGSKAAPEPSMPPCSGNPNACGRCDLN